MRVNKLGRSSVAYEVGVFVEGGGKEVVAVGGFTHVFVERESRRPAEMGIEGEMRSGLERVLVGEGGKL